jgi:DNA repair and recombination protein RAD54B
MDVEMFKPVRRKSQTKKHKTWDGDAFVSRVGNKLIMISEEGKM